MSNLLFSRSRNEFLGRVNTPEESEALKNGTCFGAKGYDMVKAKIAYTAAMIEVTRAE